MGHPVPDPSARHGVGDRRRLPGSTIVVRHVERQGGDRRSGRAGHLLYAHRDRERTPGGRGTRRAEYRGNWTVEIGNAVGPDLVAGALKVQSTADREVSVLNPL
jgi:hypothetical protein